LLHDHRRNCYFKCNRHYELQKRRFISLTSRNYQNNGRFPKRKTVIGYFTPFPVHEIAAYLHPVNRVSTCLQGKSMFKLLVTLKVTLRNSAAWETHTVYKFGRHRREWLPISNYRYCSARNKFGTYNCFIAAISKILLTGGTSLFGICMWYTISNSENRTELFCVIMQPVSVPFSKTEKFNVHVGKRFLIFPT